MLKKSYDISYHDNLNGGYHGTVMDTGTTTIAMPRDSAQQIMKYISEISGYEFIKDNTKVYDYCIKDKYKNIKDSDWNKFKQDELNKFPLLVMLWDSFNSSQLPLHYNILPIRYLVYKRNSICLDIFGDTPSILVGSNQMVNKFIIYDREQNVIGVSDFDCDSIINQASNHLNHENNNDKNKDTIQPIDNDIVIANMPPLIDGRQNVNNVPYVFNVNNKFLLIQFMIILMIGLIIYKYIERKRRKEKELQKDRESLLPENEQLLENSISMDNVSLNNLNASQSLQRRINGSVYTNLV